VKFSNGRGGSTASSGHIYICIYVCMYIYVCLCVTQHPFYKSRSNETVLLFPGGAREVFKRKGEEYRLFWPYIYVYMYV